MSEISNASCTILLWDSCCQSLDPGEHGRMVAQKRNGHVDMAVNKNPPSSLLFLLSAQRSKAHHGQEPQLRFQPQQQQWRTLKHSNAGIQETLSAVVQRQTVRQGSPSPPQSR